MNRSHYLLPNLLPGLIAALLAIGPLTGVAEAATAQQEKMTSCNADAKAKGLKGDERKAYMKNCLSANPSADSAPANSQQTKMKTCSADAKSKGLKGDERKKFMSSCLKGSS